MNIYELIWELFYECWNTCIIKSSYISWFKEIWSLHLYETLDEHKEEHMNYCENMYERLYQHLYEELDKTLEKHKDEQKRHNNLQ